MNDEKRIFKEKRQNNVRNLISKGLKMKFENKEKLCKNISFYIEKWS